MDSLLIIKHLVDTISIITDKPIKVTDVTEKGVNYWGILSSIIAVASISLVIYDRAKKIKIFGKIISITTSNMFRFEYTGYDRQKKVLTGQSFTIKISLGVYNRDLYFKDVSVHPIFKTSGKLKGEIYWANKENLNINGEPFISKIPVSGFLSYYNFIEKGNINFYYLRFFIPNKTDQETFSQVELEFMNQKGKRIKVLLEKIDEKQVFFDSELIQPA